MVSVIFLLLMGARVSAEMDLRRSEVRVCKEDEKVIFLEKK